MARSDDPVEVALDRLDELDRAHEDDRVAERVAELRTRLEVFERSQSGVRERILRGIEAELDALDGATADDAAARETLSAVEAQIERLREDAG